MRKVLIILCVLLFTLPLVAQQRTGNITGVVTDTEGNPLPGVTVTLTGATIAPMQAITSAGGAFRFLSLFPAKDYAIKAELAGFKTRIEEGVIVVVGGTTDQKIVMEMGTIEAEVVVTAVTPIIETKKTAVTQTVDYEALQSLPSARDPWVILQMVPSIEVDRENIGGNESGQQASYVAKGGDKYGAVWTMDGVNITDPAARGASPTYFDFDMFEEMNVTTSGADVETQTGGVSLNLVSRRGGNRISLGGRFYLTDNRFQATPHGDQAEELKEIFGEDAGYNKIRDIKDFGFNVGGPLWKDKAWWWGSYGVQEIKTTIINGSKDDTFLTNFAGKINLQIIPQNRFEFFIHAGKKEKFGRSSSTSNPSGWNQRGKYHFGSPIIKVQDEHMFGDNLFVSAKYGFTDAGFGLWPANDVDLKNVRWYDYSKQLYLYSQTWFFSGRPNTQVTLHSSYFNDDLFGASHEIKFGVEYIDRRNEYVSGYPGNMAVYQHYITKTVDWDGDGSRDIVEDAFGVDIRRLYIMRNATFGGNKTQVYTGFLNDTISFGNFTLKLGLRYDLQHPEYLGFTGDTIFASDKTDDANLVNYYEAQRKLLGPGVPEKLLALIPGTEIPAESNTVDWKVFSPRIGATWDVFGDGKTIAKLSGAIYGDYMGTYGYLWARGGYGGYFQPWWWDKNGDNVVTLEELYWANYDKSRTIYPAFDSAGNFVGDWEASKNYLWGGYDYTNPTATTDPRYQADPNWSCYRNYEVLFTLEREILPDLGVALDFTFRRYNNFRQTARYAYEVGGEIISKDHYTQAGIVPGSIVGDDGTYSTEEAAGKPWYVWKEGVKDIYERYLTNWSTDRHNDYMGLDLRFNKRLSNNWMLNGSFTYQMQKSYYGDNGYNDPSDLWATEGKPYAYAIGGASGKLNQPVFSRWMLKLQGLYRLPLDFNVSFTFNTREGHIVPHQMTMADFTLPNPYSQSNTIYIQEYGKDRLPVYWNLNLRLEKALRIGDIGNIFLMADVFNVFNNSILNRKRTIDLGTYYADTGDHSPVVRSGEPNEVVNPRVVRLGLRFQF